jgi:DNA polymerase-3 subunit delta
VSALVTLVQGNEPTLRDREVDRVVGVLLDGADRTLALEDHTLAARRGGTDAGEGEEAGSERESLELPQFAAIVTALQSPPFMTPVRVVVVRDVGNLTADQARWLAEYVAAPLETTRLVLVAGGGRTPAALDKAVKAAKADVVAPASEQTADVLDRQLRDSGVRISTAAAARVSAHLGDDAGRVPELVEVLRSAYGDDRVLDLAEIETYLGEAGTAGRFDLTNAIDRGDVAVALEVLHRQLHSTSGAQPKPLHPLQVMATLVFHYQRMLRLDSPDIRTREQAAEVLGMRSPGGARFPLEASRRLGTDGLREAMGLLAQAELDLRGASGLDEETVMEILVARLAALTRRHRPAGRRP